MTSKLVSTHVPHTKLPISTHRNTKPTKCSKCAIVGIVLTVATVAIVVIAFTASVLAASVACPIIFVAAVITTIIVLSGDNRSIVPTHRPRHFHHRATWRRKPAPVVVLPTTNFGGVVGNRRAAAVGFGVPVRHGGPVRANANGNRFPSHPASNGSRPGRRAHPGDTLGGKIAHTIATSGRGATAQTTRFSNGLAPMSAVPTTSYVSAAAPGVRASAVPMARQYKASAMSQGRAAAAHVHHMPGGRPNQTGPAHHGGTRAASSGVTHVRPDVTGPAGRATEAYKRRLRDR